MPLAAFTITFILLLVSKLISYSHAGDLGELNRRVSSTVGGGMRNKLSYFDDSAACNDAAISLSCCDGDILPALAGRQDSVTVQPFRAPTPDDVETRKLGRAAIGSALRDGDSVDVITSQISLNDLYCKIYDSVRAM